MTPRPSDEHDRTDTLELPAALVRDLCRLDRSQPRPVVSSEVDAVIAARTRAHLAARTRWSIRAWLSPGLAAVGAAAAAVAISVVLFRPIAGPTHPMDVDGSGRVDILDAFALQRKLDAEPASVGEALTKQLEQWDLNVDGRIDRDDVDAIAFEAVALNGGRS